MAKKYLDIDSGGSPQREAFVMSRRRSSACGQHPAGGLSLNGDLESFFLGVFCEVPAAVK